ncbi:DEAD/DEAH box helicase [Dictyocaulus viviparus]|uniref:RNA helicase n=1 Tax=Dictyocaulus viviparus TaxID=29172 RepID=A0A0D8XPN7_DICVI|nr:DEAD/DEAH box helicase [Dictyocaulus viviparus]
MNSTTAQHTPYYSSQNAGQWTDIAALNTRSYNGIGSNGAGVSISNGFDYGHQPINGYTVPPPGYGNAMSFTGNGPPLSYQNGYPPQQQSVYSQNGYSQMSCMMNGMNCDFSNGFTALKASDGFGGAFDFKEKTSGDFVGNWSCQTAGADYMEKQLFNNMNSGINFDKYESIPVEVSGENPPEAISAFVEANMHEWIQQNVDKSGYKKPTPVQKYSLPTLLGNRDLMSCAQTGSGKTAAFLLPIIHHILISGPDSIRPSVMSNTGRRTFFPSALVLAPTRELAIQIHKEAAKFSYRTNIITAILYGGRENYREQISRLRVGCHILIATPGRLIDILDQGYIGLAGCRYLVLDEADRMLDMGFEPQIRKIVSQGMPPKTERITAMFSATFPKQIQTLAQDFLKPNYVFLAVGRVGSTSENIDQQILLVDEVDKRKMLMNILSREENASLVLVFVETKRGANELAYNLQRQQINAVAIHGDLKQFERERNLELFRNGSNPVLVATAVAARGLDIPNVRHVVNYDLPGDIDEYVHRIGRTGRCGNTGRATSFFTAKNRALARDLSQLLGESHKEVPEFLLRIAAEGRIAGGIRQVNRRFGGTDQRRGGGTSIGNRGGYSGASKAPAVQNGFDTDFSMNFMNGFGQPQRTFAPHQNSFNSIPNRFATSFPCGGVPQFNGVSSPGLGHSGFGNSMMARSGFQQSTGFAPPVTASNVPFQQQSRYQNSPVFNNWKN